MLYGACLYSRRKKEKKWILNQIQNLFCSADLAYSLSCIIWKCSVNWMINSLDYCFFPYSMKWVKWPHLALKKIVNLIDTFIYMKSFLWEDLQKWHTALGFYIQAEHLSRSWNCFRSWSLSVQRPKPVTANSLFSMAKTKDRKLEQIIALDEDNLIAAD